MSDPGWYIHPFAPANSKFHYYRKDGGSLCRKYTKLGGQVDDDPKYDQDEANCAVCKRRIADHRANRKKEAVK